MYFKLEGKITAQISMQEYFELAVARGEISVPLKRTYFDGTDVYVSTVFLGSCFVTNGSAPELFETMIFGGPKVSSSRYKYTDYDVAMLGHRELCEVIAREMVARPGPWTEENNRSAADPDASQDEDATPTP